MLRMALKTVEYTDREGRRWLRGLPEGVPASQAKTGVPQGPPSLAPLGLPIAIEVRLHNQLFERGLFDEKDVRHHIQDINAAIMAAFRVDVHEILAIYQGHGAEERSD